MGFKFKVPSWAKKIIRDKQEEERLRTSKPEFQSLLQDGQLPEDLQVQNLYDPTALQAIQERALSEEQSPWAAMQLEKQGLEETMARDRARALTSSGEAQARSNLAMKGGLGGGAAERIAMGGQQNLLQNLQGVGQQGALARADIGLQDEQMRMNLLSQLPGMQAQMAGLGADIQGRNIGNRIGLTENLNQFNLGMYQADKQAWAAKQQAEATRASCFAPDTLVFLEDGSMKKIQDVKLGDMTYGGEVTGIQHYKVPEDGKLFFYNGILVAGSHAVLEEGTWKRVRDSIYAELANVRIEFIFNFSCKDHLIKIGETVFADFEETDDFSLSDDDALEKLNEKHIR